MNKRYVAYVPLLLSAFLLVLPGCGDDKTEYENAVGATPAKFAFTNQSGVEPGSTVTSNPITVSGITIGARISVTGGSYSIGTGLFTASADTVYNGQTVRVRHTASASSNATTTTKLTMGGVSATFTSTTGTTGAGGEGQTLYLTYCNSCHSGMPVKTKTIEAFQTAIDTNKGGMGTDALKALTTDQLASIVSYLTGGNTGTTPDAFTFTSPTDVALSTIVTSNSITVSGITAAVPISVTGGSYSIGTGAFTTTAGTVTNGQTVKVQHTSSASNSTNTVTTLTIGGVSATFTSTTVTAAGGPPPTVDAAALYTNLCAGCHKLGSADTSGFAPDLKALDASAVFPTPGVTTHNGTGPLTAAQISALTAYFLTVP